MQLSWQPGYSLSKKPRKRPTARRTKREASGNADRPQQFEFVAEHPVRNHGARWYSSVTTSTRSEAPVEHTTDCQTSSEPTGTSLTLTDVSNKKHVVVSDDHGPRSHVQDVEKSGAFVKTPLLASNDTSLIRSDGVSSSETIYEFHSYPCNSEDDYASLRSPRSTTDRQLQILEWSDTCLITSYEQSSRVAAIGPSPAASDFLNMSRSSPGFIAPSILYNSISHRFRPILDRCMFVVHFSNTTTTSHKPRQQGVLQDPVDDRPTNEPVSIPGRPRSRTYLSSPRCHGFSRPSRREYINSDSSPYGTPTAPQEHRHVQYCERWLFHA